MMCELLYAVQLWVTHLHPDDTEPALRESLRLLKLDYVDLYLAHMPACFNVSALSNQFVYVAEEASVVKEISVDK